jgi:hypothetical protein
MRKKMTIPSEISNFCKLVSTTIEIEKKEISKSDITNYFSHIKKVRSDHWSTYIDKMSTCNVDISLLGKAAFSSHFTLDEKDFEFNIFTDRAIVKKITKNNPTVDSIYQIWYKSISLIVGVRFHPMCQVRWNDEILELNSWEKTLTSMVLNAEEGQGSSLVIRDILYSLANKDKEGLFLNIFKVLD